MKQSHLIEQALLHHLQALEELPLEYIVRPRIVISRESLRRLIEQMESGKPTGALRDLMRDGA